MLSLDVLKAIVDEAHKQGKQVAAHVGEQQGVELSLAAGVDEWAHVPCMPMPENLLQQTVTKNIRVISTIDTMSHCPGIHSNTMTLAKLGARIFYGAEIAHTDIPWGIDAEELHLMLHLTGTTPLELFKTATSKAGAELGLAPLGTLSAGAPADIIAVKGDPFQNFKPLEDPDLVMSGGQLITDRFTPASSNDSTYDDQTKELTVAKINAFGKNYRVIFKNSGDYMFKIKTADEIK